MDYVKVTTRSRRLLDNGYPLIDLCEIDEEKVVRRIQYWESGRLLKHSLEGANDHRKATGLRESLPDFRWNDQEGSILFVQESSKVDFEETWERAEFGGDEWL